MQPERGRGRRRSLFVALLATAAAVSIPCVGALGSPRPSPHDSSERHAAPPWWRQPWIHTTEERWFFLRWMYAHYGPDWLRWMPDTVIEAHWRRFLLRWPDVD